MAELNLVEKANKVISFRKLIREICRKKGLEYPSDDKISEYIADCGGDECVYDTNDFMCDYENKLGVFRDPIKDFFNDIMTISWGDDKPTIDDVKNFVAKNGYDKQGFINEHNINSYKGVEKDTLIATLKLKDFELVKLWNEFIDESSLYGSDSHIYDLKLESDVRIINKNFPKEKIGEITRIVRNAALRGEEVRFIQWFNLNGNDNEKIRVKKDIKGIIIAYWSDIFSRVMLYPSLYSFYFDDVFFPIIVKEIGYIINCDKGTLEKIEK